MPPPHNRAKISDTKIPHNMGFVSGREACPDPVQTGRKRSSSSSDGLLHHGFEKTAKKAKIETCNEDRPVPPHRTLATSIIKISAIFVLFAAPVISKTSSTSQLKTSFKVPFKVPFKSDSSELKAKAPRVRPAPTTEDGLTQAQPIEVHDSEDCSLDVEVLDVAPVASKSRLPFYASTTENMKAARKKESPDVQEIFSDVRAVEKLSLEGNDSPGCAFLFENGEY